MFEMEESSLRTLFPHSLSIFCEVSVQSSISVDKLVALKAGPGCVSSGRVSLAWVANMSITCIETTVPGAPCPSLPACSLFPVPLVVVMVAAPDPSLE